MPEQYPFEHWEIITEKLRVRLDKQRIAEFIRVASSPIIEGRTTPTVDSKGDSVSKE